MNHLLSAVLCKLERCVSNYVDTTPSVLWKQNVVSQDLCTQHLLNHREVDIGVYVLLNKLFHINCAHFFYVVSICFLF